MIAERAEYLGVATNNVAEYPGLIAGLELFRRAHARTRGSRSGWTPSSSSSRCPAAGRSSTRTCGRWPSRPARWRRPGRRTPGSRASRTSTRTGSSTRRSTRRRPAGPRRRPPGPRSRPSRRRREAPARAADRRAARLVRRPAPPPRWCWSGTASPGTPWTSGSPAGWAAATRASRGGPGADPGHRRLAGPARRGDRHGRGLARPAHPRVRRDPRRAARQGAGRRARPRGDGVRHLGRDDVRGDQRAAPRRPGRLARLPRPRARRAASRSGSWRSGCWPASSGCSPSTPAARSSRSATSRRSRCWSPTRWARRWRRSTGWRWRRPR